VIFAGCADQGPWIRPGTDPGSARNQSPTARSGLTAPTPAVL
jgi:hypothetical protein